MYAQMRQLEEQQAQALKDLEAKHAATIKGLKAQHAEELSELHQHIEELEEQLAASGAGWVRHA